MGHISCGWEGIVEKNMPLDTSAKHYEELIERGIISKQMAHVFLEFYLYKEPVTDLDLSKWMKVDVYYVRRRRVELAKAKVIIQHGTKKSEKTNVTSCTWIVAPGVTPDNFKIHMRKYKEEKKHFIKCPHCKGKGKIPRPKDKKRGQQKLI